MKQNSNFLLKELSGIPYLLPFGQMIANHHRGLKTNSTGVHLWNLLEKEHSLEEIISSCATYYEISDDELPEFREDIAAFTKQLRAYNILVEKDNPVDTAAVISKLQTSRATQRSCSATPLQESTPGTKLLSIGGLNLCYSGPLEAFPPDFSDFETPKEPVHQKIYLHPELPKSSASGQALLHNIELNILEQENQYILHFPTAKKHLEIHLHKDGSCAHCYSLPPYDTAFHYDFFHALRLVYLYFAQKQGMAAIHSASILYKDKLWLFSGHSGMGKSTHTNLWKEHFGTPVINGDLNLLAIENDIPVVHGIPWCGTSGIYDTKTYPLGGIILVNRGTTDYTEDISVDEKLLLVSQRLISPSWTKEQWEKNMEIVEQITRDILVCKLYCTKEKSAAEVMKKRIDAFLNPSMYQEKILPNAFHITLSQ